MREIFRNPQEEAHWEFRELRKDGSQIWVKEMVKVLERSGSSPVVLIVCQDISVRKEAERVGLEALDARISKIVMQRESLCEMLQGCTEGLVSERLQWQRSGYSMKRIRSLHFRLVRGWTCLASGGKTPCVWGATPLGALPNSKDPILRTWLLVTKGCQNKNG